MRENASHRRWEAFCPHEWGQPLSQRQGSVLVFGAPPGGAATDGGDSHGRTVAGASAPRAAGLHHVAEVRTATLGELGEGVVYGCVEPADPWGADSRRCDAGRYRRPPEDFVGEEVADPAHHVLVEEPGLDRRRRAREDSAELRQAQLGGVDAEGAHVRIDLHRAEAPGITDGERAASGEANAESIPHRIVPVTRVQELVDAATVVDEEATGHAEAQPENQVPHRTVAEIDQEQLAVTPRGKDRGADYGRGDVRRTPAETVMA